MIRGIEHIGITVSDLAQAEQFFINAFGASVLYRLVPPEDKSQSIDGREMRYLNGFPAEMKLTALSMLRLANGANVEIFQTEPAVRDVAATPGQPGLTHFSVYVDDIRAAGQKMASEGAKMFEGPSDCFRQEEGRGNQTWFGMTPFGVLIELISLPSGIRYDAGADDTRWLPAS